jgi:hypothetical protein
MNKLENEFFCIIGKLIVDNDSKSIKIAQWIVSLVCS